MIATAAALASLPATAFGQQGSKAKAGQKAAASARTPLAVSQVTEERLNWLCVEAAKQSRGDPERCPCAVKEFAATGGEKESARLLGGDRTAAEAFTRAMIGCGGSPKSAGNRTSADRKADEEVLRNGCFQECERWLHEQLRANCDERTVNYPPCRNYYEVRKIAVYSACIDRNGLAH